jgi:hypothetical protein
MINDREVQRHWYEDASDDPKVLCQTEWFIGEWRAKESDA